MGDAFNAGDIVVTEGFAWSPATANNRGIIDYSTREGQSIFNTNTRCLYSDHTVCFSAQAEGIQGFLNHMVYRARQADWINLFEVPVDFHLENGNSLDLLTNYGQFTLEYLEEYITEEHLLVNDRWQQDNFQAQICMMNSLSEDALNKINLCIDDYTIANQVQALMLLKVIIHESRIETPHRTRIIRQNLSSLDIHLKKQGYDINKFNTYVQGQLSDLAAMGERTHDILANLFKAYLTAPDEDFVRYIRHKQELVDDGEEINYPSLMILAGNRYKGKMEDGTWNAPSKDQVKLLALSAELDAVRKLIPKSSQNTNNNNTTNNNSTGNKTTTKKPFQRAEWQSVAPTALEIQNNNTKKVGGKEFKWCGKHAMWCGHSTDECRKDTTTGNDNKKEGAAGANNEKFTIGGCSYWALLMGH